MVRSPSFRVLGDDDVRALLSPLLLVEAIERSLADFSAGTAVNPLRTVLYAGADDAYVGVMPAFLPGAGALGAKLVTAFGANPRRGLPMHFATVVLLNPDTGALCAIMDGRHITEMRTAAVSAVAARHLAAQEPQVLALIGTGVQARGHLELFDALHSLREVRVFGRDGTLGPLLGEAALRVRASIRSVRSIREAVAGADVVILVTSSPVPVLDRDWVEPGALVISVGACRPDHREVDPLLVAEARLFVDSRTAALSESGDLLLGIREGLFTAGHIQGELGEIILGRLRPRVRDDDVVVFKSLGLGVEDVAAAALVYHQATQRDVGTRFPL